MVEPTVGAPTSLIVRLVGGVASRVAELSPATAATHLLRDRADFRNLDHNSRQLAHHLLLRALTGVRLRRFSLRHSMEPFGNLAVAMAGGEPPPCVRLTIPLMPPPEPGQLHLYAIGVALAFARLGVRTTFLLEDAEYTKYGLAAGRNWPAVSWSVQRFRDCVDHSLAKLLEPSEERVVRQNLALVQASHLPRTGDTTEDDRVFRSVAIENSLLDAARQMAQLRDSPPSLFDLDSVLEAYRRATIQTSPHYLLTGPDRFALYSLLSSRRVLGAAGAPTILAWPRVPDLRGRFGWRLDGRDNLYPFESDASRSLDTCSPGFKKWYTRRIKQRWPTEGLEISCLHLESPDPGPTLVDVAKRAHARLKPRVRSIAVFGSHVQDCEKPLAKFRVEPGKHLPLEGDVDLLVVVDRKTVEVSEAIRLAFSPYGDVLFHPDFYSLRPNYDRTIELLVLPEKSKFFRERNLGILTGHSIFTEGRFRTLAGEPVERLIGVPAPATERSERLHALRCGQLGVKDMQARLWPYLGEARIPFDMRRVVRAMLMDAIWAHVGIWLFEKEALSREVPALGLRSDLAVFASDILSEKHQISDSRVAVRQAYALACEIDTVLLQNGSPRGVTGGASGAARRVQA